MLGALPLLALAAALLLSATTITAFKLPLRMVGDSRPGQQVSEWLHCLGRCSDDCSNLSIVTDRPNDANPNHPGGRE